MFENLNMGQAIANSQARSGRKVAGRAFPLTHSYLKRNRL